MSDTKQKKWYNSSNRWAYLKVAFLCLTTPGRVYKLAHQSHSVTQREKIIRGHLLDAGVLSNKSEGESTKIDLEQGHI